MRALRRCGRYKKDEKSIFGGGLKNTNAARETLRFVIGEIRQGRALPARHQDHPLAGLGPGVRDCHILNDPVLIYRVTDDELTLLRLGSHAKLF